jgi:hypothetical protein
MLSSRTRTLALRNFTINANTGAILLLVLAAVTLVVSFGADLYWDGKRGAYWIGYLSNVSAGFLTSAAILFFVDRAIEQREEAIRKRLTALVARRIESPLYRGITMFHAMIAAAAPTPLAPQPTTCSELFSEENLRHLDWLDLQAASYNEDKPWCMTLYEHLQDELEEVRDIARAYESRLDPEFLESIELLLEDDFYVVMRSICVTASTVARGQPLAPGEPYPVGLNGNDAKRSEFFKLFTAVVEHASKALAKRIGPDRFTARFGNPRSARLPRPHPPRPITDPQSFPG